jgi:hypothetical protein
MSTNFEQPLQWIDFDDTPIMFANQFLVQEQPHELVISIGQVTGPPAVGAPDQVAAADRVPILTLARVGLTRHRAEELIALLQESVQEHDRRFA